MKKFLFNYVVTVVDESDGQEYKGEFKAENAIDAMNEAIDWYTEQLDALPGTVKLSDMLVIGDNAGTEWNAIYRKDEFKIDHYEKGNELIKVVYKCKGLSEETDDVLWYKRDGVQYLDLNKAMDDIYHATNTKTLVR